MSEPKNILSGIRVIDCGTYIAGPAAATILSDFGAEVIKIERPPHGDPFRYLSTVPGMPLSEHLFCWILDGRNRQSVALNLEDDAARDALLRLVRTADVFITNYQPALLEKFRVGYGDLHPLNDRLIYAHVTGYGEAGEDVHEPGYDQTAYWARSGLMFTMHNPDGEPCRAPTGSGDHPTAMTLFGAIMLGLYRRTVTGQGSKVSTSLMANGAWSNASMIQAAQLEARFLPRTSRKNAGNPLVNHYVTRDQKRFLTCCLDAKKDWPNFCRALSREDLIDDERFRTPALRQANAIALVATIDEVVATKDMAEWDKIFRRHSLTWAPVQSNHEVAQDRQMEANGVFDEIAPGMRTVSSPFQVSGVKKVKPGVAPQVGEHTGVILRSLGYSEPEIAELLQRGAALDGTPKSLAKD
ncbi:MAG TPA: CoA transferase [Candidatus Angelobacter sp.]|nr:CoA transferase [Candidatus Angelobacter sp.]